ncbi:DUF6366 family protein [Cytobacillus sp. Hz8]|uniref:DUF6366 family protein n=1 Tax=Cytobacillus sp. Hz8 TaxID=3347168 RepID=UPI0035E0595A
MKIYSALIENGDVVNERRRERLKQEELKSNPTGNMNDAFHRIDTGNLADLVGV